MEKKLHFVQESIAYYEIGQPEDYYYETGLIPLENFPCVDILEKTRLLYALWELFTTIDTAKPKDTIPSILLIELSNYFEKYDAHDLAYSALLDYETLDKFDTCFCVYELDSITNNLVLFSEDIKILIPEPYENVIDEDGNDIDVSNLSNFKTLTFSQNSDFPILFMSDEQMKENELEINKYFDDIISIFKMHDFKINNCEDLVNIFNKIYSN